MDQPEKYRRSRNDRLRLIIAITLGILLLVGACGIPVYFLSRAGQQQTKPPQSTLTATSSPTSTTSPTSTESPIPTMTVSATPTKQQTLVPMRYGMPSTLHTLTPTLTTTSALSPTPWVITQVVTKIVTVNTGGGTTKVEVTRIVETFRYVTVVVTSTPGPTQTVSWRWVDNPPSPSQTPWIITATPGPTQTPWFITNTPEASQTPWIIVVTATETPTPTPTFTVTPTETVTPTPTETPQ